MAPRLSYLCFFTRAWQERDGFDLDQQPWRDESLDLKHRGRRPNLGEDLAVSTPNRFPLRDIYDDCYASGLSRTSIMPSHSTHKASRKVAGVARAFCPATGAPAVATALAASKSVTRKAAQPKATQMPGQRLRP